MFQKALIGVGIVLFVLLSATDWVMTFALLNVQPGASESNPLAALCLKHCGWNGLAVYKAIAMMVVLISVVMIARRRPPIAGSLLTFACILLLAVTTHTHELIREAHRDHKAGLYDGLPNPAADYEESSLPVPVSCLFPKVEKSRSTESAKSN